MNWLAKFLDTTDPTASLRHAAYALVVLFALGWLTYDILKSGITNEWNIAFGVLVGAVTAGKVLGQKAEAAASTAADGLGVVPESRASGPMDGGKDV